MLIIGLDLSGPANTHDTAGIVFRAEVDHLNLHSVHMGMTDYDIFELVTELAVGRGREEIAIGIDAPLSYNPGGGDRPSDRQLRVRLKEDGDRATAVMSPTMNRMAYLTLRGIALTRMLADRVQIVEVHPGAAMALGQADTEAVRLFKRDKTARHILLDWLETQGLRGIGYEPEPSDHFVAACGSALATWNWTRNSSVWLFPAQPPYHPYDFAC